MGMNVIDFQEAKDKMEVAAEVQPRQQPWYLKERLKLKAKLVFAGCIFGVDVILALVLLFCMK